MKNRMTKLLFGLTACLSALFVNGQTAMAAEADNLITDTGPEVISVDNDVGAGGSVSGNDLNNTYTNTDNSTVTTDLQSKIEAAITELNNLKDSLKQTITVYIENNEEYIDFDEIYEVEDCNIKITGNLPSNVYPTITKVENENIPGKVTLFSYDIIFNFEIGEDVYEYTPKTEDNLSVEFIAKDTETNYNSVYATYEDGTTEKVESVTTGDTVKFSPAVDDEAFNGAEVEMAIEDVLNSEIITEDDSNNDWSSIIELSNKIKELEALVEELNSQLESESTTANNIVTNESNTVDSVDVQNKENTENTENSSIDVNTNDAINTGENTESTENDVTETNVTENTNDVNNTDEIQPDNESTAGMEGNTNDNINNDTNTNEVNVDNIDNDSIDTETSNTNTGVSSDEGINENTVSGNSINTEVNDNIGNDIVDTSDEGINENTVSGNSIDTEVNDNVGDDVVDTSDEPIQEEVIATV